MPRDTSAKKSWRRKFHQLKRPFNPVVEIEKEKEPTPDDVIMKHPENGANIRIKDNGTIQMFAGNGTGIKIDPNSSSLQFFSDKTIFQSNYINFHTDRRGLRWNYQPLNPDLANPLKQVITTIPGGAKVIESVLTNAGAYITPSGPTTPGAASALSTINLSNEQVYQGMELINRAEILARGVGEAMGGMGLGSIEGVIDAG